MFIFCPTCWIDERCCCCLEKSVESNVSGQLCMEEHKRWMDDVILNGSEP